MRNKVKKRLIGGALAAALVAASWAAASCGGTVVCAPGEQQACACPDGLQEVQTCADRGSGWNACQCSTGQGGAGGGTTVTPSGGGASTGSSGGSNSGSGGSNSSSSSSSSSTSSSSSGGGYCGDGICSSGESCATCAADCGCTGTDLCNASGQCVACQPSCAGVCGGGDDGCGGSCDGGCVSSQQHCVNQSCQTCNYGATVATGDYTCGGGQPICIQQGTVDASGNVTITAKKCDSSAFSAGDYYVLVYDGSDGVPGNHCKNFNAQKAHVNLTGSSTPVIAFPVFASSLTCAAEKTYCVSKLATNGDKAWFCSQNVVRAKYE